MQRRIRNIVRYSVKIPQMSLNCVRWRIVARVPRGLRTLRTSIVCIRSCVV